MSGLLLSAQRDQVPHGGPKWLLEGSRQFLTYQALRPSGPESCDPTRSSYAGISESEDTPLSEAETSEDFWALENSSAHGFLAVELLAEQADPEAVIAYFAALQPGTNWQETFHAAFGITIEEFYQLFEERRAAGFPRPRCPTLPPLVTMPGAPEYIKWEIGDKVSSDHRTEAMQGVQLAHDYSVYLGMPKTQSEITIHMYKDIEKLASAYARETNRSMENSRKIWETATARAPDSQIFLSVSSHSWNNREPKYQVKIMAHEMYHKYQNDLSGLRSASADHVVPETGPRWLREGSAEYLAFKSLSEGGILSYESERNRFVSRAKTIDKPLSEMEKREGYIGINHRYKYFLLAAELLAKNSGESNLLEYHALQNSQTTWQEAFEKAFGMNVGKFYELFEEHRAAGFPELDVSK